MKIDRLFDDTECIRKAVMALIVSCSFSWFRLWPQSSCVITFYCRHHFLSRMNDSHQDCCQKFMMVIMTACIDVHMLVYFMNLLCILIICFATVLGKVGQERRYHGKYFSYRVCSHVLIILSWECKCILGHKSWSTPRESQTLCCYKNAMTCKKDVKRKSKHTLSCNDPFKWHHYWTVLGYVRMVEGWSLIAFRSHLSSHSSSWESCGERTMDKHPKAKQEISLTRQTVKKTAEFAVRHASRIFDDYDLKGYSQEVS